MHWGTRIGIGMAVVTAAGAPMVGGMGIPIAAAFAGDRDAEKQARAAEKDARLAEKALSDARHEEAIGRAERAVLLAPNEAAYRALLGRAYLAVGRFVSAEQVMEEALTLNAGDGRTALNLSLAKIALGDWQDAKLLLDKHRADIQPADLGLATALAGDPMAAVAILAEAARDPSANAKVRQNLALSLALAGKWQEARTVAGIDLAPAEADQRIMQWAAFAHPERASDQVASLLGVKLVEDGGMPVQLALRMGKEAVAAVPTPLEAYVAPDGEVAPTPAAVAPIAIAAPAAPPAVMLEQPEAGPRMGNIVFATRRDIVQPLPAAPERLAKPKRAATVQGANPSRGSYYVQLGAFQNAEIAQHAWGRIRRRVGALASHTPQGMQVETDGASFYRLSVGGLARVDADALCRTVKAKGGACFVRQSAGDRIAQWARGPQFASR